MVCCSDHLLHDVGDEVQAEDASAENAERQ